MVERTAWLTILTFLIFFAARASALATEPGSSTKPDGYLVDSQGETVRIDVQDYDTKNMSHEDMKDSDRRLSDDSPHGRRLNRGLPVDLVVYRQPGNTTGGVPPSVQPVLRAVDQNGNFIRGTDSGIFLGRTRTAASLLVYAIATIDTNPAVYASARHRNMTTGEDLWSKIEFGTPRAYFYTIPRDNPSGILEAKYEGLFINELGNGFTFRFLSMDATGFPSYQTVSEPINVVLGPIYRLSLHIPEGTITGGVPFRPQPTLALVDRGDNIIAWDQKTSVRVELLYGPGTLSSTAGAADFNHTVYNGKAKFIGLNLDVASTVQDSGWRPYKLRYTAHGIDGRVYTADSINLTVGIGPAHSLVIIRQPKGARGGIPFVQQPYLVVKDAGGNILEADSTSYVTASIYNNPSGAVLRSDPRFYLRNEALDLYTLVPHTVKLVNGEANFSNVAIDKVGREFRLKFVVYARDNSGREGTNFYGWTGERHAFSETFDVTHGDPTDLVIIMPPGHAWAGGSPFGQQPVIGIVDAGFNIMTPDSTSTVTATLTTSPTGFPLLGQKTLTVALGVVSFLDLQIEKESKGYVITFSTSAGSFTRNTTLEVIPSTEYALFSSFDRQSNDRMGSSCAADDVTSLVAVGAVGEDRPIDEVQIITTEASAATLVSEVQLVTTMATARPEIQSIKFSCYPGTSIARRNIPSGDDGMTSFQLEWTDPKSRVTSISRPIATEMPGPMVAAFLEEDLKGLGPVEVSRIDARDTAASCHGGCDFRVTFISLVDFVPKLILKNVIFDITSVQPSAIVQRIQHSTILGGTFTLTMPMQGISKLSR